MAEINPKPLKNLRPSRRRRAVHGEEGPLSFFLTPKVIVPSSSQFCSLHLAHLTVWRKSLLFNGHGYTVYDSKGDMIFRVDDYASNWRQETFLMDSIGNVLLTIRRRSKRWFMKRSSKLFYPIQCLDMLIGPLADKKIQEEYPYSTFQRCKESNQTTDIYLTIVWKIEKLCVWESWEGFRGEILGLERQEKKPLFTATKAMGIPSCNVLLRGDGDDKVLVYRMNWSRQQGWSRIYRSNSTNLPVAEVNRKCGKVLLGRDVLSLCVHPGVDQAIVMALLIINHAME